MTGARTAAPPRPSEPPRPPGRRRPGWRPWALAGWTLLTVLVATWLTLVEVLWLPLRVGSVLVPLSVVAAVAGTPLQVWAAHRLSGSRVVAILPAVVWVGIALAASTRRPEGDLLIVGGGAAGAVNLAFLLLGIVTAALSVGRVVTGRPLRPVSGPANPPRRGSGSGGAR